jgi:TetR/AcrR family transcriptional repressor of nem operon
MKNQTPTRERIIDAGLKALLAQGYDATGIGPLLASIDVPKGSFYHFFSSKEAFASAVLEAYGERYREITEAIFADGARSPMGRLNAYFDMLEQEIMAEHPLGGCLYGMLAHSAPALNAELHGKLAASFTRWERDLGQLLGEAQRAGEMDPGLDPIEVAAYLIDVYEGVVIRARVCDRSAAFGRFRKFALGSFVAKPL